MLGIELGPPFHRGKGGPGGWILLDKPELHLQSDILVPDLAAWRRERMPEVPDTAAFDLAPDWVCEVLSPSTAIDRAEKMPHLRARSGRPLVARRSRGARARSLSARIGSMGTARNVGATRRLFARSRARAESALDTANAPREDYPTRTGLVVARAASTAAGGVDVAMMPGATDNLPAGTMFGVYRIVRLVGVGGMGAVYEAVHTGLRKQVALKTLTPQVTRDPESLERFLREGETAARIRHANVVDITDVGVQDGRPYLVMEFLEGEDLAQLLAREGVLSPSRTLDLLLPVIAAVSAAHDEGVVHRDLKPQNIFLARSRQGQIEPKLLDFGISKIAESQGNGKALTSTSAFLGTPYYVSPEQIQGAKFLDAKTDQYSLATILYQCLTARRPYEAEQLYALLHLISVGRYVAVRELQPSVPVGLEAVVHRSLAIDKERRFPSMYEMGAALVPFAGPSAAAQWRPVFSHGGLLQPPPAVTASPGDRTVTERGLSSPRPPPPTRRGPSRRMIMIALATGMAGMVGGALYWGAGMKARWNEARSPAVPASTAATSAAPTVIVNAPVEPRHARPTLDGERATPAPNDDRPDAMPAAPEAQHRLSPLQPDTKRLPTARGGAPKPVGSSPPAQNANEPSPANEAPTFNPPNGAVIIR